MADIELPPLPDWMSRFQIPADNLDDSDFSWLDSRMKDYARTAVKAALEAARAERDALEVENEKLREALKGMEKWASSIHDGYPPSTASIAAAPYREAARAAIAKATGEVK